jgi:hypothetical protein
MPRLAELQESFVAAIYGGGLPPGDWIREDGLAAAERFQVYRRNTFTNLENALRIDYPVVERLVGGEFFDAMADEYIRGHPSTSGDANDYGGDWPGFIETFPPARALPYLADVARLEQAWNRVFLAAEHDPLDPARLVALDESAFVDLVFRLHPASALVDSVYPVHRIWQANQPDAPDTTVDLDAGGVRLLLLRRGTAVEMHPLGAGGHAFLHTLAQDLPISRALDAALAREPGFDAAGFLQAQVELGTLVDFHPAQGAPL